MDKYKGEFVGAGELVVILKQHGIEKTSQYISMMGKRGKLPYKLNASNQRRYDVEAAFEFFKVGPIQPKVNLIEAERAKAGKKKKKKKKKKNKTTEPDSPENASEDYIQEIMDRLSADPNLVDSKIFQTIYQAKISKQKFDVEAKKLIYRDEAERQAFIAVRTIRDQLLTLPEKIAGQVAALTDYNEIKELMYQEITSVLQGLAEAKDLFDADL